MIKFDYKDKVALVTGSSRGIGYATAKMLLDSGVRVMINGVDEARLGAASKSLSKHRGRVIAYRADLKSRAEIEGMFKTLIDRWGGIDILVNNAADRPVVKVVDMTDDIWDRNMDTKLKGAYICSQLAARQMIKQGRGGSIIHISSKSGVRGSADNSAYNATKFGVIGLAQGWAQELARHNIRVNSVLPGNVIRGSGIWNPEYVASRAKRAGISPEEVEEFYTRKVPLGRQCEPRDVANMVVFLVSERASYVTGGSHLVDGGQEMR